MKRNSYPIALGEVDFTIRVLDFRKLKLKTQAV